MKLLRVTTLAANLILSLLYITPGLSDVLDERFVPELHSKHVRSWREMRSEQVVLQKHEYSCGAASLATLLKGFYGLNVSEQDVIASITKKAWWTMADMQASLASFGFKGIGLAMNYEQLTQLKIPAIAYINTRSGPHYVVLRGITKDAVLLADPALGNSLFPTARFIEKWHTRINERLKGKILVALPLDGTVVTTQPGFFTPPSDEPRLYEKLIEPNLFNLLH